MTTLLITVSFIITIILIVYKKNKQLIELKCALIGLDELKYKEFIRLEKKRLYQIKYRKDLKIKKQCIK